MNYDQWRFLRIVVCVILVLLVWGMALLTWEVVVVGIP